MKEHTYQHGRIDCNLNCFQVAQNLQISIPTPISIVYTLLLMGEETSLRSPCPFYLYYLLILLVPIILTQDMADPHAALSLGCSRVRSARTGRQGHYHCFHADSCPKATLQWR